MSRTPFRARSKRASAGLSLRRPTKVPADKNRGRTLGVVSFCLHGNAGERKSSDFTAPELIGIVEAGLPIRELQELQTSLDMPMETLASKLDIAKATLHRRKRQGRLQRDESDRVIRFARLLGKAIAILESEENARRWLTSPQLGLGGAIPLDYAKTEVGAREVEDLLGRIEYGVYS